MLISRATAILVLLASLALPCSAAAQKTNAPPGNSGVDEYLEVVPGGGGNRPSQKLGSNRGSGRGVLGGQAERSLERQGREGRAAANLAEATGDSSGKAGSRARGGRGGTGQNSSADSGSGAAKTDSSDDSGVLASIERVGNRIADGQMGTALPVVLLLLLVFGAVAALVRRRRSAAA